MSTEPQIPRAAHIFISFIALLRANGFAIAPEQTTGFLAAIELLGPRSLEHIRKAGLATLAPLPERRATFDRLFDIHFRGGEQVDREGADEDIVRLQEEGRGDEEPLLADEANDAVLVMNVPTALASAGDAAHAIVAATDHHRQQSLSPKPVFAVWVGGGDRASEIFDRAGIPDYATETEAVGGFMHESHSFAPMPTRYANFVNPGGFPPLTAGAGLFDAVRGTSVPLAGAIVAGEAADLVPLAYAFAIAAAEKTLGM